MAIRLRKNLFTRFLVNPWGRAFIFTFLISVTLGLSVFTYFYVKYAGLVDGKLRNGPFANTSLLYAAPRPIRTGDPATTEALSQYLLRCGYTESNSSRMGWYKIRPDAIEINPGPDAFDRTGAVIKISGGEVREIIALSDHAPREVYYLEPELITNLFDSKREKRRIVRYNDIPKVMVNAALSAEDKHFFQHSGFDPIAIARAVIVDLTEPGKLHGASTITQQVARTLWLGTERGWRRKVPETLITIHLEQKLSKQQIFEYYANSIYLGNQGSFSIQGFGEGALAYFGKDLSEVTLPEAAMLAGLPQSGRWNPFRFPERAQARRNIVLKNMMENGYITKKEYDEASATTVAVKRGALEFSDAPYFVDMIDDTLRDKFPDRDFQRDPYRVYTTLDLNLQKDAVEAVRKGLEETDAQWHRRSKKYGTDEFPLAQAALVALDAETGEVKAIVGGRNYGVSQLNHVLAKRQPGSSFKPFVYTAALMSALEEGGHPVLTPASTVIDEPTTFWFDDSQPPYEPSNHEDKYFGVVTLRYALAHSLNIPAVKVAEMIGYNKVSEVARTVGLNVDIKPTPSIALGAYEVTPLEIAGAYTVFPNGGDLLKTTFIKSIRDQSGTDVFRFRSERTPALDPRIAYLVENMMEEVIRSGTAVSLAGRGFKLPAAGKTGTSRDGWFAGFTSKLICVIWVGFDDNRDFKLEGAHSALPIWAEFMKRAHEHPEYKDVKPFEPPEGVISVDIDPDTGERATAACPKVHTEVFIAGTEPTRACRLHGGGRIQVAAFEPSAAPAAPATAEAEVEKATEPASKPARKPRSISLKKAPAPEPPKEEPKKSVWDRFRGLFGGK